MSSDSLSARREDELAIRDLACRYARVVDRHDYALIPRVFTPDCELTGVGFRMRGHAELDAGLRKIEMYSATLHCVHNQTTHLAGDRAEGEFYCVANHIHERDGVPYKLDMGIRYEDEYVRTADGWRIARRTLVLIWQQDLPLDLSPSAAKGASGSAAKAARAKGAKAKTGRARAAKAKTTSAGRAQAKRGTTGRTRTRSARSRR